MTARASWGDLKAYPTPGLWGRLFLMWNLGLPHLAFVRVGYSQLELWVPLLGGGSGLPAPGTWGIL